MGTSAPASHVRPSWTRAARGFSCIFWGILLGLLLFSGFLSVRTATFSRVSPELPGLALVLAGSFFLWSSGALSVPWHRAARRVLAAAVCVIGLAPFLSWWRAAPQVLFFSANMMLLMAVTLWFLLEVHRLVAELGRITGNITLLVEARMCLWSTALLYGIPLLAIIMKWSPTVFDRGVAGAYMLPIFVMSWPMWIHVVMVMPFLLVMAIAWEAKEICLKRAVDPEAPAAEPTS